MPADTGTRAGVRLALIRQRFNPYGGAERFIERAIAALENDGIGVTLIAREWRGEHARAALIVNPPCAGRLWRDVSFARAVRTLLATEHFDLVQSHERIPGCDLYRAGDGVHRRWLHYRSLSASFAERLGIRLNPYHWYTCAAEKAMFEHPRLRAVICNSKMVAGEIAENFAIAADKLHVIYNGVDLEYFHPERRAALRGAARREFGCASQETVFGFVGSGFARKGLGSAIAALAATGREDFRLLVAGSDRASKHFEALARRAGIGARVSFLGGREDVRPVYAASDCFILPTRYDPFPNAALEALAMGVPVIVSDRCGAAELVAPGVNGWICRPDRPAELSRLMIDASQAGGGSQARSTSLSHGARRSVEGYGIAQMSDRMVGLYMQLLGRERSRRAAGN